MITTILLKINLIKTSNNVLWNIFHKTLILFVFIHVNNLILSQLRRAPATHVLRLVIGEFFVKAWMRSRDTNNTRVELHGSLAVWLNSKST